MAKKRTRSKTRVMSKNDKKPAKVTAVGQLLRELGGLGGGLAGGALGLGGLGSSAGRDLAGRASKWLGFGDYEVKANTIVRPTGTIPAMHKDGQSIIVRHREYLGELDGSTDFSVRSILPLNPGMQATFPWLATVASRFQEYRIRGLVYHFVPTSGTAISSTSAALGSVMFQTSYRATDTQPNSKVEMLNEYWATEGRPCDEIVHAIECDPRENPFEIHYVRTGQLAANENQLMYDLGTTFVATSGMQTAGQTVGDLWVTYEIELKKPVVSSSTNEAVQAVGLTAITSTASQIFPGTDVYTDGNLPVTVNNSAFTIPAGYAGYFYFYITMTADTAFTSFTLGGNSAVNCVLVNISDGFATAQYPASSATSRAFYNFAVFKPDAQSVATYTITNHSFVGSSQKANVAVFRRDSPIWP